MSSLWVLLTRNYRTGETQPLCFTMGYEMAAGALDHYAQEAFFKKSKWAATWPAALRMRDDPNYAETYASLTPIDDPRPIDETDLEAGYYLRGDDYNYNGDYEAIDMWLVRSNGKRVRLRRFYIAGVQQYIGETIDEQNPLVDEIHASDMAPDVGSDPTIDPVTGRYILSEAEVEQAARTRYIERYREAHNGELPPDEIERIERERKAAEAREHAERLKREARRDEDFEWRNPNDSDEGSDLDD